jgi:hypothetical protein
MPASALTVPALMNALASVVVPAEDLMKVPALASVPVEVSVPPVTARVEPAAVEAAPVKPRVPD